MITELQVIEERGGLRDAHLIDIEDVLAVDLEQQCFWLEPATCTARAEVVTSIAGEEHSHVHPVRASLQPAEPAADAEELSFAVDDLSLLFG